MTMQEDIDDLYIALGEEGRKQVDVTSSRPSVDEVLRGITSDGGDYALRCLLGPYLKAQRATGFATGDTVIVVPEEIDRLCDNGWSGSEAMFHDYVGEVIRVGFSPYHDSFIIDVCFDPCYRYWRKNDRDEFHLHISDGPRIYMFRPESLMLTDREY